MGCLFESTDNSGFGTANCASPQFKQTSTLGNIHTMGSFKPSNPGTCIAISPLNVLSLSEPQALQVIRVELCLARWDRKGQKLPVYLISFGPIQARNSKDTPFGLTRVGRLTGRVVPSAMFVVLASGSAFLALLSPSGRYRGLSRASRRSADRNVLTAPRLECASRPASYQPRTLATYTCELTRSSPTHAVVTPLLTRASIRWARARSCLPRLPSRATPAPALPRQEEIAPR